MGPAFFCLETLGVRSGRKLCVVRGKEIQLTGLREGLLTALQYQPSGLKVDTPVPYRLGDMLAHIDAAMPPQASKQASYLKIKNKAETLQQDSRFSFICDLRPSRKKA